MIEINNILTPTIDEIKRVIYGMRNPLKSWNKSDTDISLGDKDKELMLKLCRSGAEHRKFMRMMNCYMDITAPLFWWKEFDTYKIGTVRNSTSTMHTITNREFTIADFSHDRLDFISMKVLREVIANLNLLRDLYLTNGKSKKIWDQIIELLPSSYMQMSTVMISYETLRNIYFQRRNHKLYEWHKFCEEIEKIDYSFLITEGSDQNECN